MSELNKKLENLANNSELKATSKSINQTQRNLLVSELTRALLTDLVGNAPKEDNVYSLNDFVNVGLVDNKTIEFAIDNEKVGIIPMRISVSLPNFDTDVDLFSRVEDFNEQLRIKAENEKQKLEEKQKKIKADIERREKQAKLKAEREKTETE